MNLSITHEVETINWEDLCDLLRRGFLGERQSEVVRQAFSGSFVCSFAWNEERLIGAARAISDGATHSAIYDVIVDPEFQGQGIGKKLMESLLACLPKRSVMLVSVRDKERFYQKLGFRRLRTAYMLQDDFRAWELGGYFYESKT